MSYPVTVARTREWNRTNARCAKRSSPGVTTCPNTPRCTGARARADWPDRAFEAATVLPPNLRKLQLFLYISLPFLLPPDLVLLSVLTLAKSNLRDVIVQPKADMLRYTLHTTHYPCTLLVSIRFERDFNAKNLSWGRESAALNWCALWIFPSNLNRKSEREHVSRPPHVVFPKLHMYLLLKVKKKEKKRSHVSCVC